MKNSPFACISIPSILTTLSPALNIWRIRCPGSAAIGLEMPATGRLDGCLEFRPKPWDCAAGYPICEGNKCCFSFSERTRFPLALSPDMGSCPSCWLQIFHQIIGALEPNKPSKNSNLTLSPQQVYLDFGRGHSLVVKPQPSKLVSSVRPVPHHQFKIDWYHLNGTIKPRFKTFFLDCRSKSLSLTSFVCLAQV